MVTRRIERKLESYGSDHKVSLATSINPKIVGVDAIKNAAQSQLLPLRVIVQILFDGASTSCDIYNNKHYY
ncbi:hypothetical protein YC2023_100096 [Brassica napus]